MAQNKKIVIGELWIIKYPVPRKEHQSINRPFIVCNLINQEIYGIPLTSFQTNRYRPNLGDFLFEADKLLKKSIVKPYQIINIKNHQFISKIDDCPKESILKINLLIDQNSKKYLAMRNTSAILREYVIERQNQRIEILKQEINNIKNELIIVKEQLILIQKDRELLFETANNLIKNLELKLENLQQQLTLTQ